MRTHPGYSLGSLVLGMLMCSAWPVTAQVPIPGLTGTLGLPGSVDKFYSGVNKALVKIDDGVDHLGRPTKRPAVHGDAATLASLRPGTTVIVRYTVEGIPVSSDDIDAIAQSDWALN